MNYNTIGPNTVTVTIQDYPTITDHSDAATIEAVLGTNPTELKVQRTIYANGEYNTLCLPFALDESALSASPLAGYERLKTFRGASVSGSGKDLYIDIFVEDATTIEAGKPYFISYPSASADIVNPVFTSLSEFITTPGAISADGVTFQGMFAQVHIDPYTADRAEDYLFLGANSQLNWPSASETSADVKMRGLRAYFIIDRSSSSAPAQAPRGSRVRLVDAPRIPTAIENTEVVTCTKMIENGQLVILKNGIKYNAQGQIIK